MASESGPLLLAPFDFEDPELTPKTLAKNAPGASVIENSAYVREFYRLASNRFPQHAPLGLAYVASHLKAGLTDDAIVGIVRVHLAGVSIGKILRDAFALGVSAESFLHLEAAAIRHGALETVQQLFDFLVRDNFSLFVGDDGKVALSTLTRLQEAGSDDAGILLATLTASGDLARAVELFVEAANEGLSIEPQNIHVICGSLARKWAKFVASGWFDDFCRHLLQIDFAASDIDPKSRIVAGCALFIGGYAEGLSVLNMSCEGQGEIKVFRDRSIAEWLEAHEGRASPRDETYRWDRSVFVDGTEHREEVTATTKPQLTACLANARLYNAIVLAADSAIIRDNIFHPYATTQNLIIEQGEHKVMLAYIPQRVSHVAGDVILADGHWNFFHSLMEKMGKATFAIDRPDRDSFKLLFTSEPSDGNIDTLESLGFSRDNIIVLNGSEYVFERLWLGSIPYSESWAPNGVFEREREAGVSVETLETIRRTLQHGTPQLGQRRLYLSRRDAIHRKVENEDEVCAFLSGYGFEIIQMTALSIEEQCALVRDAQIIVGVYGAQLTSAFWAPTGCHVVELCFNMHVRQIHYELPSKLLGLDFTKVCCDLIGPSGTTSTHPHPNLLVPLDQLKLAVERVVGPQAG